MATSGTVYSSYARDSRLYVKWWVSDTDIANNRTLIGWEAGIDNGNWWYLNAIKITSVYIDGGSSLGSGTYSDTIDHGLHKKLSGSKWVYHDSAGAKSITVSINGWFYDHGNKSGSNTYSLPTIPRQANLTSAPNFNDEENPTIKYSNPAGNSVTSLEACISLTGSAADVPYRAVSKTGSSYTFNLSDAERKTLRQAITSGSSRTVKFYLRTTIGGNTYYSSVSKTLSLVNYTPTLSPTVVDSNETTKALTGDANKFIKYYSNAAFTVGATARKEASISSRKVVCGGKSSTSASGTLSKVESGTFAFSTTDSRGHSASKTLTKTLVPYVKLTVNHNTEQPTVDGNFTFYVSGNYFNGSFGATSNTLTVQYRYKVEGGSYSSWTDMTVSTSGNSYSATVNRTGLDYTKVYYFQARAIDKLATVNSSERRVKSQPVFDWSSDNFNVNGVLSVKRGSPELPNAYHAIGIGYDDGEDEWRIYLHKDGSLSFDALDNGSWLRRVLTIKKNGNVEISGTLTQNTNT